MWMAPLQVRLKVVLCSIYVGVSRESCNVVGVCFEVDSFLKPLVKSISVNNLLLLECKMQVTKVYLKLMFSSYVPPDHAADYNRPHWQLKMSGENAFQGLRILTVFDTIQHPNIKHITTTFKYTAQM